MRPKPSATPPHPALQRARRITGRRGPRPLTVPWALNLGHATLLSASLFGLMVVL